MGGEVQHQRHQDGAYRVYVFDRVERDAPHRIGGAVAKVARRVTVGGFVHGDGEQHRQRVKNNGLNQVGYIHGRGPAKR